MVNNYSMANNYSCSHFNSFSDFTSFLPFEFAPDLLSEVSIKWIKNYSTLTTLLNVGCCMRWPNKFNIVVHVAKQEKS